MFAAAHAAGPLERLAYAGVHVNVFASGFRGLIGVGQGVGDRNVLLGIVGQGGVQAVGAGQEVSSGVMRDEGADAWRPAMGVEVAGAVERVESGLLYSGAIADVT
ncbi:hypothetical protein GCM10009827_107050 [Dactylosporangium maewongense]|uniref:Uncharacterized protein n=1 Tax=Dactylosporangium maewongense TaxID=634393 RepID=A0ABN2D0D4_9ACTN